MSGLDTQSYYLGLYEFYFPFWGNKVWIGSKELESENVAKFSEQKGLQKVQFDAPGTQSPLSHSVLKLDDFPFSIISPLG